MIIGISTCFIGCNEDVNTEVCYVGKVVHAGTTNPFADLEVKVTNGDKIHCIEHTNTSGEFMLQVKVGEVNGSYYILIGDASCITKQIELSGFGQAKVDLGTIEIEGPTIPTVTTKPVSNISDSKATCGGNVTADGRSEVTARGVCWAKSEYPTIDGDHTENGKGLGEFTCQMTDLEQGVTYYVRAYATNKQGTAYGDQFSFSTATGLPQVTTDTVSEIFATSAVCGGEVAANSGYPITARGICWSNTTASPTTSSNHTEEVATTGHFKSMMIGLERNTTYYVRAYAVNEKGPNYGETKVFTTLSGMPTVTTAEVTNIKTTSALGGGNVTNNGGYIITARGICWSSITSTPTTDDSHTNEVADNGVFTSLMTELDANTTYYVRAYATNEVGTAYGTSVSFTSGNGLPTVETLDPGENITSSSISAVGNVIDDGGFEISTRGFVYSTLPYPTLENSTNMTSGSGVGYFSANITNITPTKKTYYIRAYATNSLGTAYGDQVVVTPERSEYLSLKTMSYGGYTYKIKPLGPMAWQEGYDACENMVYGGYSDWFMPDDGEVQAIITYVYNKWGSNATYYGYSYSSTPNVTQLFIEGEHEIWASNKDAGGETYFFYIYDYDYNSYNLKYRYWKRGSTSGTSLLTTSLVFAVRKYRTDNQ